MSTDAAVAVVSKVRKSRKPKSTENVDVKTVDLADVSPVAVPSGAKAVKAPRHPRFDPTVPSNYFNLRDVWSYRDSQRRNLQKMKVRVENAKDDAERAKLTLNVLRNEKNLRQLEENMSDVQRQSIMVAELLRAGVKVDDAHIVGVVNQLVNGLVVVNTKQ